MTEEMQLSIMAIAILKLEKLNFDFSFTCIMADFRIL